MTNRHRIFVFAIALCACGTGSKGNGANDDLGGSPNTKDGAPSDLSQSAPIDSATPGDAGFVCPTGGPYGGGEVDVLGGGATAVIVDQDGAPVAGQPLYICGIDICSDPGKTDAQGNANISTTLKMKRPAFKFGDAVTYAELSIPLTAATNSFGSITTALLPATGATLTPGTTATSGDVSLTIPANSSVAIDGLVYDTPATQQLRVAAIPVAKAQPVLAQVMANGKPANFALLYGLAPAETIVCPAAKMTVALPHLTTSPNDLGWAAGTAVEFWITTVDSGQTYAPYAGWAKASDGVVSADGQSASTLDGQGFDFLEVFAVRLKD